MVKIVRVDFWVGEAKYSVILISALVHVQVEQVVVVVDFCLTDLIVMLGCGHDLIVIVLAQNLNPFAIELTNIRTQDLGFYLIILTFAYLNKKKLV